MPINENFIINLKGKSFVTYEGLLDLAHQKKLHAMDVELIQVPNKDNNMTAICKATAYTDSGKYTDFGDASPNSVNTKIVPHLIRMASTRAKARALRDLTNVGMTAIEEINTDDIFDKEEIVESFEKESTFDFSNQEPPTKRQVETLKKLSSTLNIDIDYNVLTKQSAGSLISKMLDEKNKRH